MANYDQLTFTNDFMFSRILESEPEICREILSRILPWPVEKITFIKREHEIKITPDGKGVCFDVLLRDAIPNIYSFELLNYFEPFLAKRSRYYLAASDMSQLQKGQSYSELNESILIVISTCKRNMPDRAISTYRRICVEDRNEELRDGTSVIFVNPWGKRDNISKETALFLDYLQGLPVQDPLADQIDLAVEEAKKNTEWRRDFMLLEERYKNERNAGREEGIKEGIKKGIKKGIVKGSEKKEAEMLQYLAECQAKGLSLDEAIRMYRDQHPSAL